MLFIFTGHELFRGNRYRYGSEYGTMLLFDSNGHIAGMQVAVMHSFTNTELLINHINIDNPTDSPNVR